jgi:hypothetical protein
MLIPQYHPVLQACAGLKAELMVIIVKPLHEK